MNPFPHFLDYDPLLHVVCGSIPAGDTVLKTVGVIISWGVLFVEIWLLVTYRKEWKTGGATG